LYTHNLEDYVVEDGIEGKPTEFTEKELKPMEQQLKPLDKSFRS
jgi:hypothetical protein